MEEARYWGSWKGRVVKAIAVDGTRTWEQIRDQTGLSFKSLQRVLAELFQAKAIEKRGEGKDAEYRVSPTLYKAYRDFLQKQTGTVSAQIRITEEEQRALISWIDQWKDVKSLDFSLQPDHFYLEGRFLDDFSKDIICRAKREVLVVSPYVEKCALSDTLGQMASQGTEVILLTRPPEIDSEQYQEKKQEYHGILKKDKVRFFYNKSVHAKIVVVDRAVAIVSSMNFNPRSSGGASWEAGIVTVEQTVVEAIADSVLGLSERHETEEQR